MKDCYYQELEKVKHLSKADAKDVKKLLRKMPHYALRCCKRKCKKARWLKAYGRLENMSYEPLNSLK